MFNTSNSGRSVVKGGEKWKSRSLDLGNRHRTTMNFGDLVPAFWQHVCPGDKVRCDATILAKFLPLIAPAFTRMKIKSEWFYVPLRQIAPPTLRLLQDFRPDVEDMSSYFQRLMSGSLSTVESGTSENQQYKEMKGVFALPAGVLNGWLVGDTATTVPQTFGGDYQNNNSFGSDFAADSWRTTSDSLSPDNVASVLGQELLVSYSSKFRNAKFMSYLGLPTRVTTMRYFGDVLHDPFHLHPLVGGSDVSVDDTDEEGYDTFLTSSYRLLAMPFHSDGYEQASIYSASLNPTLGEWRAGVGFASLFPSVSTFNTSGLTSLSFSLPKDANNSYYLTPMPFHTTYSAQSVTMLPAQAYQKIYNDFYRDEKLQPEEIRYYPYAIYSNGRVIDSLSGDTLFDIVGNIPNLYRYHYSTSADYSDSSALAPTLLPRLFNNLFGLRRRNRDKDVLSSCVTSQVVKGQLNVDTNETVYDAKLQSRLARFFMKREFTGSTWAEWLNNFFGVNSNDLLNNNVIFLGGRDSVVSISENIQNSESTETSAQGNRAGLANDFHSGKEIYFRVPDFGVLMCVVSVLPDSIDNYNGLQERFIRNSVFDFNLPDFQNIGFSPVKNWRNNIGYVDSTNMASVFPSSWMPVLGDEQKANGNAVFGYQPYGYSHTYTPNIISGDLQRSLRYWHQSPDLDFDFSKIVTYGSQNEFSTIDYDSWVKNQLQLNWNLPCVGLRSQPYGADLKSQYYNNVFAVTNDESGDHIVCDMRFACTVHRNTAFFTEAIANN